MKLYYLAVYGILTTSLALISCQKKSDSVVLNAGTNGKKLVAPVPGTNNNDLDVAAVVKYMKATKIKLYGQDGKSGLYKGGANFTEVSGCIGNNPKYWSTLVRHFFCLHGSYQAVTPNMRGCFSRLGRQTHVNGRGYYPEVLDYCTYQAYDAVTKSIPAFNEATLVKNKIAGNKVGVMKYLTDDEREVFRYVLDTWYNPFAFKEAHQQEVLDQFWGKGKYKVETQGKALHRDHKNMIAFMKTVQANGNEIPWKGMPGVKPKPPVQPPVQPQPPIRPPVQPQPPVQVSLVPNSGWYKTSGTKCELNISNVVAPGNKLQSFDVTWGSNCSQSGSNVAAGTKAVASSCQAKGATVVCTISLSGASTPLVVQSNKQITVTNPLLGNATWNYDRP